MKEEQPLGLLATIAGTIHGGSFRRSAKTCTKLQYYGTSTNQNLDGVREIRSSRPICRRSCPARKEPPKRDDRKVARRSVRRGSAQPMVLAPGSPGGRPTSVLGPLGLGFVIDRQEERFASISAQEMPQSAAGGTMISEEVNRKLGTARVLVFLYIVSHWIGENVMNGGLGLR